MAMVLAAVALVIFGAAIAYGVSVLGKEYFVSETTKTKHLLNDDKWKEKKDKALQELESRLKTLEEEKAELEEKLNER